jgi:uroporphyrinogen-III synthase
VPTARGISLPDADGGCILITRPEPGASETAARVTALGFTPIVAPLLEIIALTPRLPHPGTVAAVLVTSANALPVLGSDWRDRCVLTVGDATAAKARQAGLSLVTSAGGDAGALATLARERLRPADGTLLLLAGQRQGQALATDLRGSGYRVLRRVVYAAVPVATLPPSAVTALTSGQVRAALFFSAETARQFVRLIRRARLVEAMRASEAVAIGHSSGVALRTLPWRRIAVAAKPTQDEMLALLQ